MPFRLNTSCFHLTYKFHLPIAIIVEHVVRRINRGQPIYWSIVHESADEEAPYEHTHALFKFATRCDITSERAFDIVHDGIVVHPHIKSVKTGDHEANTWTYHEKAPVNIERFGPGPKIPDRTLQAQADSFKRPRTLLEACTANGIEIKSVTDVQAIRRDRPTPALYVHQFPGATWTYKHPTEFTCLFISGSSGMGKTQWALHLFRSPFLCSHIDDLKHYDETTHDGIVFDDMSFFHLPRESVIHLCDFDLDRSIHCRHHCALIPAGTRKVFTSNKRFEEVFPPDEHGAIKRRFQFATGRPAIIYFPFGVPLYTLPTEVTDVPVGLLPDVDILTPLGLEDTFGTSVTNVSVKDQTTTPDDQLDTRIIASYVGGFHPTRLEAFSNFSPLIEDWSDIDFLLN
ncbi:replication associated protein [Lake Sarah-associated circular virus-3]|uniref:replication associated protein n=1 Tax=Lake Sarah-associated circular virus-3 TaxID=1685757 RepID=UPI000776B7DC|nr:replication associated protein [Lake Sarah-associated circular virus-3]ALE29578.1 replication associated protein [Lake Sarah-associated circular virus-3]ALE29581.1 replication associated protein [Lake Sarah-associated circular virus-3]